MYILKTAPLFQIYRFILYLHCFDRIFFPEAIVLLWHNWHNLFLLIIFDYKGYQLCYKLSFRDSKLYYVDNLLYLYQSNALKSKKILHSGLALFITYLKHMLHYLPYKTAYLTNTCNAIFIHNQEKFWNYNVIIKSLCIFQSSVCINIIIL